MRSLSLITIVALATSVSAAEKIDNPEFASWSKFKVGTTATWKMESKFDKVTANNTITTKLLEVTADKLVLEMTTVAEFNGMKNELPPMKREVTKQIELPAGTPKPMPGGKPEGTSEEGKEKVKAAGVEYDAKWYKYTTKLNTGNVTGQIWTSEEVPGGVVKMISKGDMFSTTMELTELKKP